MIRWRDLVAGLVVGWLVTMFVFLPQLLDERDTAARLTANERKLAHVCTFERDGSAACPAGTFTIDRTP